MYNKILKKYSLLKLITLVLPKKKGINAASYYLCKYLIKNTPYVNIQMFIKEISKLVTVIINSSSKKSLIFVCSKKIFLYNYIFLNGKKKFSFLKSKKIFLFAKNYLIKNNYFVFWYNNIYKSKKTLVTLKDSKIITIGFTDYINQPNSTDYTILLEGKFFSSIFLFHFILKKILNLC